MIHGQPVVVPPCIANADHTAPVGSIPVEPKFCQSCGRGFLRHAHEPQFNERELLMALTLWGSDGKLFAAIKRQLLALKGPTWCDECQRNPIPIAERVQ